jgi:hypothetical protein
MANVVTVTGVSAYLFTVERVLGCNTKGISYEYFPFHPGFVLTVEDCSKYSWFFIFNFLSVLSGGWI